MERECPLGLEQIIWGRWVGGDEQRGDFYTRASETILHQEALPLSYIVSAQGGYLEIRRFEFKCFLLTFDP